MDVGAPYKNLIYSAPEKYVWLAFFLSLLSMYFFQNIFSIISNIQKNTFHSSSILIAFVEITFEHKVRFLSNFVSVRDTLYVYTHIRVETDLSEMHY